MIAPISVGDFCRYALDVEEGQFAHDPVRLGAFFREYTGIQRTPSLKKTIDLVRSLGINIQAVPYLQTGGTNMTANDSWYIHYSDRDRPPTQKFDILHELFEVIHKSFDTVCPGYGILREPQLSQYADRFAAATLIPPRFFLNQVSITGCDLVKLSEELELSHQCIIIALGQHFVDIPLIGVLYEYRPDDKTDTPAEITGFTATIVVKTGRARRIKELCGLQVVPARNSHPHIGSLVCAAVNGGRPVLWRSTHIEDSPVVLVRPLLSVGLEPYRIILLAIPNEEFGMISSQVDRIEPMLVNGDTSCPSAQKCRSSAGCIWKAAGGYYERRD
jgi:hypothetical protein